MADPAAAETAALLADLHRRDWPNKVVALRADPAAGSPRLAALFAGKERSAIGPATICARILPARPRPSGWKRPGPCSTPGKRRDR